MSSAALRPGPALGFYPERREPAEGWLERAGAGLSRSLHQRRQVHPKRLRWMLSLVEQHAKGLRRADDAEMARAIHDLRCQLHGVGLTPELVGRSFAIVQEVAGRTLGMRHFDVQLIGGWVMIHGMLAEMETGEGKTLTATLPAATAALAGIPTHVVTVNDYLVARDAKLMRPVYEALGLSVGTVTGEIVDPGLRREAYASDVTYCTNKQLTFDYLRDRIVRGRGSALLPLQLERLYTEDARIDRLMLRGLCFAIVDEADSVLIDEARTPLILSRTGDASGAERTFRQALTLAGRLQPGVDFAILRRERDVRLTERGKEHLAELALPLEGVWTGRRRREELALQALSAEHLYLRDDHYLLRDGKVQIIDQHTGRLMPDRSWECGLHQMIETKEECELTGQRETLARISFQQFFRRYLRLGGMTGTAREVAGELWSVYRLRHVTVPTHRPVQRRLEGERIFATRDEKWAAVITRIREVQATGRPVLVGTRSVADSEHLSRLLHEARLPHQLLNARQDSQEAEIVARAGGRGCITIATNMAGRGTDIGLGPGVAELGGLHVIGTERSEARRIDRQLLGRCGRQGDPGSFESLVSLEDELVQAHTPARVLATLGKRVGRNGHWADRVARSLVFRSQLATERRHAQIRRALSSIDDQLGTLLAFTGPPE